jgi:hypothetical protein
MSKILKNPGGSPITVTDTGVTIAASSQYTIPEQDYLLWAASSNVITYIGAGTLVVNDGSADLNISDGTDLIKGLFERTTISSPLINNITIAAANTEQSFVLPTGCRQFSIRARNNARLQLAFASGQSGTNYVTLYPGANHKESRIRPITSPVTLYFQASKTGEIVEILTWT